MRTKIGECLVQAGLISPDDLRSALAERKRTGERLGAVLVRMNLATEERIAQALALQLGFPYLDLAQSPPDPSAIAIIPKRLASKRSCVAVSLEKNVLTVAMDDPLSLSLVHDLETRTDYRVRQVVATRGGILAAIEKGYPGKAAGRSKRTHSDDARNKIENQPDARETDLVRQILHGAVTSRASDIHIDPMENDLLVRYRIEGVLKEAMRLPRSVHAGLLDQLKAMTGMDPGENRLPQQGRMRVRADDGTEVDFRGATLRTLSGEKLVLRVLDRRRDVPPLEELGMPAAALEQVRQLLARPRGMFLVAGPNGSGKTTTLGAAILAVKNERTNVVTIEDPVEYLIPGVNQTSIDETIGLTFATALRSALRQDADVILLSELRDAETAAMAMRATQECCLILSALSAENASTAITRLVETGSEPAAIASGVAGVVAQRLVRRLCEHCRRSYAAPADVLRRLGIADSGSDPVFYAATGCDQCNHTGYRGRIGIFEVMRVTEPVRSAIVASAGADRIREAALAGGMVTLGEDGLAKVKAGITTVDELLGVVPDVREARALCTGCGAAVAADFSACARCGRRIGESCPHCSRVLKPGWNFCPYCARSRPASNAGREAPGSNVAEFRKP